MSAKEFRAKIAGWQKATQAQIAGIARQSCFEASERVVMATPVDTGFLRGSWQPAIGAPKDDKGVIDTGGGTAIAQASLMANGVVPGDRFYMTNNAKYAGFVEYGTSKMGGRFYVQGVVKQWQAIVNKVAKELGVKQ